MKNKSFLITACCLLAFISSFTQNNASSKQKSIGLPAWLLTGNSGTSPSKNFIGTRDAQPLLFKVNNQRAGYLEYNDFSQTTAFGYQTLISNIPSDSDGNTGGIGNSAFGYKSLYSNRSGELNTAIGQLALTANTTGDVNTSVGAYSLLFNTQGAFNTAIGSFSLFGNQIGSFNTATGDYTLFSNTTGSANIANGGSFTLTSNTEGSFNIATGVLALTSNTTGNANIAYGSYSLATNVTGNNNTALGDHADVTAGDINNATAIGAGALVDASNKVSVGNAGVTSIGGQVGWTSFSDERIKDNIKENVPGLEFIKALRPVTYHFNAVKENALLGIKDITVNNSAIPEFMRTKMPGLKDIGMTALKNIPDREAKSISNKNKYDIEKIQFTGFLAQDVDRAAKKIGYDFSGIDRSGKLMGLRYSDFVVPLVKAVQELSKINDENNERIEKLQKQIDELKVMISNIDNTKMKITLNDASLEQNMPNPFNKTTSIGYSLPEKFTHAQIVIADKNGKTLKRVDISGSGKGSINVNVADFSAGTYHYSLIIDGKTINSKQMVLAK